MLTIVHDPDWNRAAPKASGSAKRDIVTADD
jgi:hypothetical protein